ncbi:hypothetical protein COM19_02380 [Bacillus toyonensis]|nr:hypothetical protein COM19_02380 [Bacillus toyonensis]
MFSFVKYTKKNAEKRSLGTRKNEKSIEILLECMRLERTLSERAEWLSFLFPVKTVKLEYIIKFFLKDHLMGKLSRKGEAEYEYK